MVTLCCFGTGMLAQSSVVFQDFQYDLSAICVQQLVSFHPLISWRLHLLGIQWPFQQLRKLPIHSQMRLRSLWPTRFYSSYQLNCEQVVLCVLYILLVFLYFNLKTMHVFTLESTFVAFKYA